MLLRYGMGLLCGATPRHHATVPKGAETFRPAELLEPCKPQSAASALVKGTCSAAAATTIAAVPLPPASYYPNAAAAAGSSMCYVLTRALLYRYTARLQNRKFTD